MLLGLVISLFSLAARSSAALSTIGVIALVVAFVLYQAARESEALQQFALACSMAGQVALAIGCSDWFSWRDASLAGFVLMLQLALTAIMNNPLHRFLSACFAVIAAYWWLVQLHAMPLGGVLLAAGVTLLWLTEPGWVAARQARLWRPVAYALVLGLLFWHAMYSLDWDFGWRAQERPLGMPTWSASLAYLVCLVTATGVLARRHAPQARLRWMAAALCVAAAAWLAPGLMAALLVLLLGQAAGNRILVGLALLAAVWYLGAYYYQMHISLLQKSWVLMGSGAALLGLRAVLSYWWREAATPGERAVQGEVHE
jgi:hypothetical protein